MFYGKVHVDITSRVLCYASNSGDPNLIERKTAIVGYSRDRYGKDFYAVLWALIAVLIAAMFFDRTHVFHTCVLNIHFRKAFVSPIPKTQNIY